MLEGIVASIETWQMAMIAVTVGIAIRFYFGHTVFHPRYVVVWDGIRTMAVPLLNKVAYGKLGVNIENRAFTNEFVAEIDEDSVRDLSKRLNQHRDFEVPLLAGYKTDWEDNEEIGTLVSYHGDKWVGGAPHWLRDRQLHMTFFRTDEGKIRVVAHEEANSYRPVQWKDHLFGETMNAEKGVKMAENVLRDAEYIEV